MRALKLIQIVEIANRKFPFDCSEPWDNSGIQVGNPDRDIKNIAFCLDVHPATIRFAKQNSCELLISHHPLLINPIKKILTSDLIGETIVTAVKSDVDVLSLHTNLDAAEGGLNDYLAQLIGLSDVITPINAPCSRVGNMGNPASVASLDELVRHRLAISTTSVVTQDLNRPVSRIFLASGSGAGYLHEAIHSGADVMITGDVKYHSAVDALRLGISVIDAGHFGMEKHAVKLMADCFRKEFENMGVQIGCHECAQEKDPFVLNKI